MLQEAKGSLPVCLGVHQRWTYAHIKADWKKHRFWSDSAKATCAWPDSQCGTEAPQRGWWAGGCPEMHHHQSRVTDYASCGHVTQCGNEKYHILQRGPSNSSTRNSNIEINETGELSRVLIACCSWKRVISLCREMEWQCAEGKQQG